MFELDRKCINTETLKTQFFWDTIIINKTIATIFFYGESDDDF